MGLFGKLFGRKDKDDEPDVFDADETYELLTESLLYTEAQPLRSTSFTIYPKDIFNIDTDALLEHVNELPFEFRYYFDARRALSKGLKSCIDEVGFLESYEGGESAVYSTSFDFDDKRVTMELTLSKASDDAPFAFTVDIGIY